MPFPPFSGLCRRSPVFYLFCRAYAKPMASVILSISVPAGSRPHVFLCRQDFFPVHTPMVVPARRGPSERFPFFGNTSFFPHTKQYSPFHPNQSCPPGKRDLPFPFMFSCAGRIAFLHILPWSCPSGEDTSIIAYPAINCKTLQKPPRRLLLF